MKSLKLCVGASAGGHTNELMSLLEYADLWPIQPSVYITSQKIMENSLKNLGKTYVVGEINRYQPYVFFVVLIKGIIIMLKEKPDVILTTGSLPLAIVCLAGKLFSKKVIWIDSVAQSRNFSMSGKLMYFFADRFYTQWSDLSEKHKKAVYAGALL